MSVVKVNWDARINGTSFYDVTVRTSAEKLNSKLGQGGDNGFGDKVRFEWHCETADGTPFSIYDWKQQPEEDDVLNYHIGGHDKLSCFKAKRELEEILRG
jgi:hypothetical protein